MKIFFGFARFAGGYRSAKGIVLFLAVLALSAGCGHKTEQPASTSQESNAAETSQSAVNASTPSPTTNSAAPGEPDLADLNRAVRKWMITHRAVPKDFDDFVAKSGASIPPAPAGKKYILNQNMRVQLVNQ